MASLNKIVIQRWLQDQRAANEQIEKERVRRLLALNTQDAQRIYLALYRSCLSSTDRETPSFLLIAMRRVLAAYDALASSRIDSAIS